MTFASSDGTFTELWGNAGIGLIYEVVINATNAEIHIHADLSYVEDEEVGSNDESGSDPNGGDSAGDPNPIEDHVSELPTAIKFSAASINCSSAIFRFELPQPAQIALDIFDFSGRQVGSFSIDAPAGYFEQTWAGEQHGNRLPSGVYFGRARINGSEETFESTTRVLLVR